MTSALTGVFGHALVFGLAPILRRLAALVLLPLYTHYLSASDYGEIELLTIATGLVTTVLQLELRPAFLRAWLQGEPSGRRALLGSASRMMAVLAVGGALAFLAASGPLSEWLLNAPIGWGYRAVLSLGIFAEVASLVLQASLQARLRSATVVALGIAQFVVGSGLTVACVVGLGTGPVGFFIGGTAGQLAGLVAMAVLTGGWRGSAGPWTAMMPLIRYSLPLLGTGLLFFVVRSADRMVVAKLLSVAELGIYAMAWTLANLLMTAVFLPLQASLDVWKHRMAREPGGAQQFAEVFRMSMLILGVAAAGLVTVGLDLFLEVADPRFAAAAALVPALTVGVLLQAGYSIVASAFFVTGATGRWSVLFAAAAVVQVIASAGAVLAFGLAGAPAGVVLANTVLYAGAALWGRRLWAVPYRHDVMVALVLLLPAMAALRWMVPLDGLLLRLGLPGRLLADAAACLLFAGAGFALRLYDGADAAALFGLIQGRTAAGWRRLAAIRG